MKRINIIRCGHDNDHRAVWTALDVKRLGVHVARDGSVEVHVASQIGCVGRRERGVDIDGRPGKDYCFSG